MASLDNPDTSSFSDAGSFSDTKPWPFTDRATQSMIERFCLEDGAVVPFETLPRPRLWSYFARDEVRTHFVIKTLVSHSAAAQRRLRAPEVDALSEHANRTVLYDSAIDLATVAIAAGAAWRTRKTFKFPFQAKAKSPKFDPDVFPARSAPWLKGPNANVAWHVTRTAAYAPLVLFFSGMFFFSLGLTSMRAHVVRDQRLSGLLLDIGRNNPQIMRRAPGQPGTSQSSHSTNSTPTSFPRAPGSPQSSDQMSPQSGLDNLRDQPQGDSADAYADPDQSSAAASSSWARNLPSKSRMETSREAGYNEQSPRSNGIDADLFDQGDDASPVATSPRAAETRQASSNAARSSWENIRQQSRSGNTDWARGDSSGQEKGWAQLRQDKAKNSREVTPNTNDYSFSQEDKEREERKYEKDEAQKEFDAFLEAERRGQGEKSWRSSNSR